MRIKFELNRFGPYTSLSKKYFVEFCTSSLYRYWGYPDDSPKELSVSFSEKSSKRPNTELFLGRLIKHYRDEPCVLINGKDVLIYDSLYVFLKDNFPNGAFVKLYINGKLIKRKII